MGIGEMGKSDSQIYRYPASCRIFAADNRGQEAADLIESHLLTVAASARQLG